MKTMIIASLCLSLNGVALAQMTPTLTPPTLTPPDLRGTLQIPTHPTVQEPAKVIQAQPAKPIQAATPIKESGKKPD